MEILLNEQEIQRKIAEMGAAISAVYGQRPVNAICLLENGFMFTADLVRHLSCPVVCQFVKLEMQDVMEDRHERRLVVYTPQLDVRDRDLLLMDCVLQTGVTLDHLIHQFHARGASSVRTAVLVDKTDDRRVDLKPDFFGFQMQGRFLVGYGLGHKDLYRNLPHIATMAGVAAEPRTVSVGSEAKE